MCKHTTDPSSDEIPYGYCHCGCGRKTRIANRNNTRYGYVKGEPRPYLLGHHTRRPIRQHFLENFKQGDPDSCWPWQGSKDDKGYGWIVRDGKKMGAHRVAYQLLVGPIPEGMCVMHSCDNPLCCNPAHLSVGTDGDNMRDRTAKNRQAKGSRHGRSKLTEAIVRAIRKEIRRLPNGRVARDEYRRLMEKHHISHVALHNAVTGKTWKHVT